MIGENTFPAAPVFERMLEDDLFDPFILVIPHMDRGNAFTKYHLDKTYNALKKKYSDATIIYSMNEDGSYIDISNKLDMFWTANPYDHMTHENYGMVRLAMKGILSLYSNYAFPMSRWCQKHLGALSINSTWKMLANTEEELNDMKQFTLLKGMNVAFTGYCKMDALRNYKEEFNAQLSTC